MLEFVDAEDNQMILLVEDKVEACPGLTETFSASPEGHVQFPVKCELVFLTESNHPLLLFLEVLLLPATVVKKIQMLVSPRHRTKTAITSRDLALEWPLSRVGPGMQHETLGPNKGSVAPRTSVRTFSCMPTSMNSQLTGRHKGLVAISALEGSVSRMIALVDLQRIGLGKSSITQRAAIGALSRMGAPMYRQLGGRYETLIARIAMEGFFSRVRPSLMINHVTLLRKSLPALGTRVWFGVHASMTSKTAGPRKLFGAFSAPKDSHGRLPGKNREDSKSTPRKMEDCDLNVREGAPPKKV
jgi:hypothetical protein